MIIKGLITAAGKSSRMGEFKPLMDVNGFPMAAMTIQSLKNAGVKDITVVIGRNADIMRKKLAGEGIHFVENRDYETTDMLTSIKMGLKTISDADGIYFLPGDVPETSTINMRFMNEQVLKASNENGIEAVVPFAKDKPVHPPFFFEQSLHKIINWEGEGGLKGVWSSLHAVHVQLPDQSMVKDIDLPSDYLELKGYMMKHAGVSESVCESLYAQVNLPEHIRAHCRAVGDLAAHMAEKLIENGYVLDVTLCKSGGYLHDICRLEPEHEKASADYIRQQGYEAVADVVSLHKGFESYPGTIAKEWVLVCLADKLLKETARVSIQERYAKALNMVPVKEHILESIRVCNQLIEEYEMETGEKI